MLFWLALPFSSPLLIFSLQDKKEMFFSVCARFHDSCLKAGGSYTWMMYHNSSPQNINGVSNRRKRRPAGTPGTYWFIIHADILYVFLTPLNSDTNAKNNFFLWSKHTCIYCIISILSTKENVFTLNLDRLINIGKLNSCLPFWKRF